MKEKGNIFDTNLPVLNHLTWLEWHSFINGIANELSETAKSDENAQPAYYNAGVLLGYILTDDNNE